MKQKAGGNAGFFVFDDLSHSHCRLRESGDPVRRDVSADDECHGVLDRPVEARR